MRQAVLVVRISTLVLLTCACICGSDFAVWAQESSAYALAHAPAIEGPPPPVPPAVVSRDAQGRVTLRATRINTPLHVDGLLNEEVYGQVASMGDFIQQEPHEGQPATEKTDVWVLFDDKAVYISARCWDSHPERMVANEMRRDNYILARNENFGVSLDTFYDHRNAFMFHVNAVGGLTDSLTTDERDANKDWNTVWDAKTTRFAEGWTVEMVIPFKSLRYRGGGPQVWGLLLRRVVRWKNEVSYITPVPASYGLRGLMRVSSSATLVGIETPTGGRNLELKPYVLSSVKTDREADPSFTNDLGADVGFDVKYGVTRGLNLDFSYNTDFAQVEADEQQVNLTRFSLFFPEKREFFLEGRGIFAFGGGGRQSGSGGGGGSSGGGGGSGGGQGPPDNTPILFFSRRIGLVDELTVPIRVGGRLTGRSGRYTLGVLNIQTGAASQTDLNVPATNFSVIRVKRDILRRSSIGFIATSRSHSLEADGSNQQFGVDTSLSPQSDLTIDAYYARTKSPGVSGNDASYRAALDYAGDRYGVQAEHLTVEDNFNPEMGFLRREDFRLTKGKLRFSPRPKRIKAIRKIGWETSLEYFTNNRNQLESRQAQVTTKVEFENGDEWKTDYERNFESLDEPFEITDDVSIPIGAYRFDNVRTAYTLGPQRKVSGSLTLERGGFYGGDRTTTRYQGRIEVSPRFSVEPNLSMNWVNVPQGRFTLKVISGRASFAMTPRMDASALIQYASSIDAVSSNIRFHWEYQPGSDLFIVYSEGRNTLVPGFPDLQNRSFAIKFTRLFRF